MNIYINATPDVWQGPKCTFITKYLGKRGECQPSKLKI